MLPILPFRGTSIPTIDPTDQREKGAKVPTGPNSVIEVMLVGKTSGYRYLYSFETATNGEVAKDLVIL